MLLDKKGYQQLERERWKMMFACIIIALLTIDYMIVYASNLAAIWVQMATAAMVVRIALKTKFAKCKWHKRFRFLAYSALGMFTANKNHQRKVHVNCTMLQMREVMRTNCEIGVFNTKS